MGLLDAESPKWPKRYGKKTFVIRGYHPGRCWRKKRPVRHSAGVDPAIYVRASWTLGENIRTFIREHLPVTRQKRIRSA
jgi:hypothetical protein